MGVHQSKPLLRTALKTAVITLAMALAATIGVAATPPAADAQVNSVECNIVTGAVNPAQQVARLYKAVFRRPPEPGGWNYWKGVITTTSLFDIAAFFVEAPEFTNLYGSANNDQFVRLVYQNVMGREPDPEGYQYWLGAINRGELTRADMVVYFSESSEFKRRESDLYFEQCAVVVSPLPSVMWSGYVGFFDYIDGGGHSNNPSSSNQYLGVRDGSDQSTTYAIAPYPSETGIVGASPSAQQCVSWRSAPTNEVQSALESISDGVYNRVPTDYQGNWARPAIERFQSAVAGLSGYPVESCESNSGLMLTMAAPIFSLLPDLEAQEVRVMPTGHIRRHFVMGTDRVRELVIAGESAMLDFYPDLKDDLALADEWNRDAIAAGIRPSSSLTLEIELFEDPTGNLAGARFGEQLWLRHEGNAIYRFMENVSVLRVPTSG